MKFIRFACLSMLILTLTLAVTACDISDLVEVPPTRPADSRPDTLDRIEDRPIADSVYRESRDRRESREEPKASPEARTLPPSEAALPAEQIEVLVLEHAGVAAADTLSLRTWYEVDDRIPVYDVEFCVGDLEYEYTVHAETGDILEFERDLCDHRSHEHA